MYVLARQCPAGFMPSYGVRAGTSNLPLQGDMGSWLSSAFHSITGTRISDVIAPIAGIAGSIVGGPLGGAVGGLIGNALSGGGSGGSPAPAQQSTPQGSSPTVSPLPQGNAGIGTSADYLNGIANIVASSQLAAVTRAATPAPAGSLASPGIDNKTLLIGGAMLLAVVLLKS